MKRADILRTLADDPECKLVWLYNNQEVPPAQIADYFTSKWYLYGREDFPEIRLRPKLRRFYGCSRASGCVLFQTRNDDDTHYADLDERGCGEIKEIEK